VEFVTVCYKVLPQRPNQPLAVRLRALIAEDMSWSTLATTQRFNYEYIYVQSKISSGFAPRIFDLIFFMIFSSLVTKISHPQFWAIAKAIDHKI